jgi:hypothetical protein
MNDQNDKLAWYVNLFYKKESLMRPPKEHGKQYQLARG